MKAKIFFGPAESGKTVTASILHNFFGSDRTIYFNGQKLTADGVIHFLQYEIKEETRLIIIDDVPAEFDYMAFAHWLPDGGTFIQNKKGQSKIAIELKDIYFVFTTNCAPNNKDKSFNQRFELIEFPNNYFFTRNTTEIRNY